MFHPCTIVPLSAPGFLRASEISHNSIRLNWQPADGATQYLILCSSAPNGGEDETKEVMNMCWSVTTKIFLVLKTFTKVFNTGVLPSSLSEVYITLIPKPDKGHSYRENYQPISLMMPRYCLQYWPFNYRGCKNTCSPWPGRIHSRSTRCWYFFPAHQTELEVSGWSNCFGTQQGRPDCCSLIGCWEMLQS